MRNREILSNERNRKKKIKWRYYSLSRAIFRRRVGLGPWKMCKTPTPSPNIENDFKKWRILARIRNSTYTRIFIRIIKCRCRKVESKIEFQIIIIIQSANRLQNRKPLESFLLSKYFYYFNCLAFYCDIHIYIYMQIQFSFTIYDYFLLIT